MHLTLYTDYSLRVLMYLALKNESATIPEIAETYNISRNHLIKVVHNLGKSRFIETSRGRNGGIRLAVDPKNLNLGKLVRITEPNFHIVECFDTVNNECCITPACKLQHVLHEALKGFFDTLDGYTLADIIDNAEAYKSCFPGDNFSDKR